MAEEESQSIQSTDDNPKSSDPPFKRRSRWKSSLDALGYMYELSQKPELKIRESDRVTGVALLIATPSAILCLVLHKLSGVSLQIMLLSDFFLGVALIIYVMNRLGILTALPPRQALLTWQLIQAFTYVGIFIAVNTAIIMSLILSSLSLSSLRLP